MYLIFISFFSPPSKSLIFIMRIHLFASSFLIKWAISLGGCPSTVNKSKTITVNVKRSYTDIHQILYITWEEFFSLYSICNKIYSKILFRYTIDWHDMTGEYIWYTFHQLYSNLPDSSTYSNFCCLTPKWF